MNLILEEFNKSGLIFDKSTQSLSSLPYDYDSVKLKSNSYVSASTFNNIIEKLNYNLMYLYRSCNVGSFEMFKTYRYTLSSKKTLPYFTEIENNYEKTTISYSPLSGSKIGIVLPYSTEKAGSYVFFSDRKNLTCIFTGRFNTSFVFNTNNIDPLSGDIKYKNISDIKSDYYDNLYILDSGYNNIYQFKIDNFISNENIYREKLFVKGVIGGFGDINDNNKFNSIKNLAVNRDFVVVQDIGDKCFKIYDKNLNWLSTFVFFKIFKNYIEFEDILLDNDNNLYCCKDNYVVVFTLKNNVLELKEEIKIEQYLEEGEYVKQLRLSISNNKILYLVTNKSVKKAWITNLRFLLGSFEFKKEYNTDINWLSVGPVNELEDIIVLYSKLDNSEQFSVSYDTVAINTLLNSSNFDIYTLDELTIDRDEYVQSWVILKNLQKNYYNALILLQNIKYRFFELPGSIYPIISEKIYNLAFLGYSNPIEFEPDFNIGINEVFQAEVINRAIKQIIDFQSIILINILNNKNEVVYLSPEPEKGLVSIKQFIYFVDDSLILSPNPVKLEIFNDLTPGGGILTSLGGAPYNGIDGILVTEGVNI